jgi:hypothetical protein
MRQRRFVLDRKRELARVVAGENSISRSSDSGMRI